VETFVLILNARAKESLFDPALNSLALERGGMNNKELFVVYW
jgi:hypothetical protein